MPGTQKSTFPWSVLLVILPIAMLAAVAAYALKQRKQTMRQEAAGLCHARH
jgi:predicted membrane-bound mannosyltransferase